jgi:catechol 2,3-dioxygenase-like lactoylglutathione lyase family enzyme
MDRPGGNVIDHVYISVSDISKSSDFYGAALKPLGWHDLGGYDGSSGPEGAPDYLYGFGDQFYGGGVKIGSSIWLRERQPGETGLYIGLVAADPKAVDAAYAAAIKAGGKDDGAPGLRTYFGPGYYAANVIDFDGNRLEFVNKRWNPQS